MGLNDLESGRKINGHWIASKWYYQVHHEARRQVGKSIYRRADFGHKGELDFKIKSAEQEEFFNGCVEATIYGDKAGAWHHALARCGTLYTRSRELRDAGLIIRRGYHYFATVDGVRLYFKLRDEARAQEHQAELEELRQYAKIQPLEKVEAAGLLAYCEVR